jgi:hypothetical protein
VRRSLLVWALFGHAAISELSQLSGVKRELDFESAKGCFWRKADLRTIDDELRSRSSFKRMLQTEDEGG